jgi:hypothetical protein
MKALIAPNEVFDHSWISSWNEVDGVWQPVRSEILNCQRVAQVEPDNQIFPVVEPLYWFDCPDNCEDGAWYFKDGQVAVRPINEPKPNNGAPGVIA